MRNRGKYGHAGCLPNSPIKSLFCGVWLEVASTCETEAGYVCFFKDSPSSSAKKYNDGSGIHVQTAVYFTCTVNFYLLHKIFVITH